MIKKVFKFYKPRGGMFYGWWLMQNDKRVAQGQTRFKRDAVVMANFAMNHFWGRKVA